MRCDEHKSLIQKNVYVHIINRDREHHSFTLHCVTYMFKYTFIFVEFVCFNITLTIYASIIFYSEYFLRNAFFNPLCTQRNSTKLTLISIALEFLIYVIVIQIYVLYTI